MRIASSLEAATVLFVHDSPTVEALVDDRLPALSTRFATSVEDAYAAYDASVLVVCVADTIPTEPAADLRRAVLARNAHCQFVRIASSERDDEPDGYDEVVVRPVAEDDFRAVLERRLTYGLYGTLLKEYYLLNATTATPDESPADESDAGRPTASVAGTTGDAASERVDARLDSRRAALREELDWLAGHLGDDDVEAVSESLRRHRRLLADALEPPEGTSSKYHPGACPNCGLGWGGSHRSGPGRGFETIGAGVWRCARCGEVTHGLHDSNQRVNTG